TLGMPFLVLGLLTLRGNGPAEERGKRKEERADGPRAGSMVRGFWATLRRMGELSIQIYLMHPILLQFLSWSLLVRFFRALPLPSLWLFLTTLFGTFGIALLLDRIPYVNQVLFGKERTGKVES
ncbi:MAG: hypothetical protein ACHQ50_07860, partial [Fimbriimonadales bacterium]